MRAHTTLRTAFQFGIMMAAAAGVSFASGEARADVADSDQGANTSIGTAELKYDYNKGLDTSIDTGYRTFSVSKVSAGVRAVVRIDPVKNGGPLYSIEMPKGAVVEASWGTDKKILLKAANGASTDGTVKVRHTLSTDLDLQVSAFGATATFTYDATKLLNKIPGARFNYDSKASQSFQPWGFAKVDTKLTAPDLQNSELFSMDFNQLPEAISNNIEGYFGVRAVTNPTFSYKTTKVNFSGADGTITQGGGEISMEAVDGDFLETMAAVEGSLDVAGNIDIQPFVHFDKVFNTNITVDIPVTAFSQAYTVPTSKVSFQTVLVHIPLPNVHAPKEGVDLGSVKAGGTAKKTVTIENSGEKAAVMTFKSSDPAFQVPTQQVTVDPKGTYDLEIAFAADNAGPAAAEITVASNDPDSPEQKFKIGANGADVGGPAGEDANLPGSNPNGDSGCGCKTAGGTSSIPSWAGFGLLGLGAVVFVRRRRNAA